MMFLKSKKQPFLQEKTEHEAARAQLVRETFGGSLGDDDDELPPLENLVVLLWMFRNDSSVTRYLTLLIETHALQNPELVVDQVEVYLPQIINLALSFWDSQGEEQFTTDNEDHDDDNINTVERLLLILAQLSTRFALQYHWTLQSLLMEQQPEQVHSGKPNRDFDTQLYVQCMTLSANLERCMNGQRQRTKPTNKTTPTLEIVACYGGKVTNDEFLAVDEPDSSSSQQSYYETIVMTAQDNASRAPPLVTDPSSNLQPKHNHSSLPIKDAFGGVLLFKRQHRKAARRKPWKKRYFAVEEGMLNCYSRDRQLLRSLPLDGATIWKGPQKKYPHSFIVANDEVLFYLRASTEEQKTLWKRKLHQVIREGSTVLVQQQQQLSPVQLERQQAYQNGKWFGRMLTETTQELDGIIAEEREEYLFERFFELEMPKHIVWPWRSDDVNSQQADKQVYVVLPHFSHVLGNNASVWRPRTLPRYQASFWLAENSNVNLPDISSGDLDQLQQMEGLPEMPDVLKDILFNLGQSQVQLQEKESGLSQTAVVDDNMNSVPRPFEVGYDTSDTTDIESSDDDAAQDEKPKLLSQVEIEYISPMPNLGTDDNANDEEASVGTCSSNASSQTSLMEDFSLGDEFESSYLNYTKDHNDKSITPEDEVALSEEADVSVELAYIEAKSESDSSGNAQNLVSLQTKDFRHDDVLLIQLMQYYQSLFQRHEVDVKILPPRTRRISVDTTMMEIPRGCMSISKLKESSLSKSGSLREYMVEKYKSSGSYSYELAQENLARSLAGLSLVSYMLDLPLLNEDNLEIDQEGHLHMKDISRELGLSFASDAMAPFKVKQLFIQALDGPKSVVFQAFQDSFLNGLKVARQDLMVSISLIKMTQEMKINQGSRRGEYLIRSLRQKLMSGKEENALEKKQLEHHVMA